MGTCCTLHHIASGSLKALVQRDETYFLAVCRSAWADNIRYELPLGSAAASLFEQEQRNLKDSSLNDLYKFLLCFFVLFLRSFLPVLQPGPAGFHLRLRLPAGDQVPTAGGD